ncbi:division/cell wall cluster transcriptional repressor MraZ [Thermomonas sp. S9]|uniref:division/cell wall cluster transcriptional repressor MraZ n=1 Tax=Thermomonas sp. S9 TaxID=2885203 RepID=UPI001AC5EBA5|nr:division/cell wall cluster transcriptional repressor MraZ [Thermomonas sp. S9]MBN8717292.1 division/cell wall cluster transcriptional repressor MraZ [Xanthomonadales bacterium]MBN8768398.1 division/cell wall cluster transcriptional repressor MraZ [Stenotrophomonas sp.]MCR6494836.1 division/cell wall cluster transcriptional repressor MraZ [Thermomonas sp. S9]
MFHGETAITIDDKGRLAIPTSYRDLVARACGNRLVVTYSPFDTDALYIYPHHVWETLREKVNALPKAKRANRILQFKLVGAATFVEPDGSGRISLPASHRAAVGIDRKVVLQGSGDKFELRSEQAHLGQVHQVLGDEDMDDDLLGLPL